MRTNREIADMLGQLGHDERELAEYVIEGLLEGRKSYGELDLDRDPRDWHDQAAQEHRDALVYLACAALARRRAKARTSEPVDADALSQATGIGGEGQAL